MRFDNPGAQTSGSAATVNPLPITRLNQFIAHATANNVRKRAFPILDYLGTAALGAWWMTRLLSSYAGPCCRVRRISDSATLDIPFASDGIVDTSLLFAFAGSSTLALTTLYDQKGTNNLTQTDPAKQPLLDLTSFNNGIPPLNCDNGRQLVIPSGLTITSRANCSVWMVTGLRSNRLAQAIWDFGATPRTFGMDVTPQSAFSVQPSIDGSFQNFGNPNMATVPQSRPSAMGLVSSSGSMDWYANGAKFSRGAVSAVSVSGGFVPYAQGTASLDLFGLVVFNIALPDADIALLQAGLPRANGAAAPTPLASLVLQGDSIVAGAITEMYNYRRILEQYLPPQVAIFSFGKGGDLLSNMSGDAAVYVDRVFKAGLVNIAGQFAGVNDIATGASASSMLTNLDDWITGRRSAGFKILVGTLFSRNVTGGYTSAMETQRVLFNAGIRSRLGSNIDAVADFDSDTDLVPIKAADFPDNLHPAIPGYRKAAPILANAIASLIPTVSP